MILNQALTFPGVGKQSKHLADNNKQSHFSVTGHLWRHSKIEISTVMFQALSEEQVMVDSFSQWWE